MNILVPIDGSETSKKALNNAINIAKEKNAKIYLLSVVEKQGLTLPSVVDYQEKKAELSKILKEQKSRIESLNLKCESILKTDREPNRAIIKDSERYNIDLIVIGRRGLNKINRIMVGTTSFYVIANAKMDVLVISED